MTSQLKKIIKALKLTRHYILWPFAVLRGVRFANKLRRNNMEKSNNSVMTGVEVGTNPLWDYFEKNTTGRGIWKPEHYFNVYHKHLQKFVGNKVDILEIGIFSGGSMKMWKNYFGDQSHVFGVDIEESCRVYEDESTSIFIGDQADRNFWNDFNSKVDGVDIVIDDGGHRKEQQMVTLEEILPRLRPGGVFICEDVSGTYNNFTAFAAGLVSKLNQMDEVMEDGENVVYTTSFQSAFHSIHFYPWMVVIEKHQVAPQKLPIHRRGTEWHAPIDNGRMIIEDD